MRLCRATGPAAPVLTVALAIAVPDLAAAQFEIEEVVVTAQKREESLQDTGLSVTALGSEALSRAGVDDMSRIELVTPGLSYAFSGSDAKIAIRGANSDNTFLDNSSIAGFFVDGVYRPRAAQQSQQFFDVERVEVLKGPQGTLYGRNTFAGAINLYSRQPDLTATDYGFEVSVERFNRVSTEGFVNGAISDTVATRLAVQLESSDGHIRNVGVGGDLGQEDSRNFRLSTMWAASDDFDVMLRLTSLSRNGTSAGIFAAEGHPRPVNATGLTDIYGEFVDVGNPNVGTAGVESHFATPQLVNYNERTTRDSEEENATLEVNWALNQSLTLKSISSYTDFDQDLNMDQDFSGRPGFQSFWDEGAKSLTQELQLTYAGAGPWTWTGGIYYSEDRMYFGFSQYRSITAEGRTMTGLDANGDPHLVLEATPMVEVFGRGNFTDFSYRQEVDADVFGIFAQSEYALSDRFRLVLGARYSEEEKYNRFFSGRSTNASGADLPGVTPFGLAGRPASVFEYTPDLATNAGETFDNVTWRAGFLWDVADDILVYANSSTGFLSGGLNRDGSSFGEQDSQAYEVGAKSRFLNGTVQANVALYRNEFENLTTQELVGFATRTVNGGEVDVNGLEVDLTWLPTETTFVSATASLMDASYGAYGVTNPFQLIDGQPAASVQNGFVSLDGTTPPWSPDVTLGLSLGYDIDLGSRGRLTPFIQFYYSGEYNTDDVSVYSTQIQDSYTKTDLRLIWQSGDERWSIEGFVENIEDEDVLARTNVGGDNTVQTSYLYPRNYGVRVSMNY